MFYLATLFIGKTQWLWALASQTCNLIKINYSCLWLCLLALWIVGHFFLKKSNSYWLVCLLVWSRIPSNNSCVRQSLCVLLGILYSSYRNCFSLVEAVYRSAVASSPAYNCSLPRVYCVHSRTVLWMILKNHLIAS